MTVALLPCHDASLKAAPSQQPALAGQSLPPPHGLSSLGSSENAPKGDVFHGATVHTHGPCVTPLLASALSSRPVCLPHPLRVTPVVYTLLCAESMTTKSEPPCRPLCLRGWRTRLPSWHLCKILVNQSASTQGGHGTPMEGCPEALPACRSGQGRSNC